MVTVFRPGDLFELADRIEKRGREFYQRMSRDALTPRIRALFERLAHEEDRHEGEFRRIADEALAMPFEIPDGYASPEMMEYLDALHRGGALHITAGEHRQPPLSEEQALLQAIEYEKDAILLLHEIYDLFPPSMPARAAVADLIRAEKSHLARICGLLGGAAA